MDTNQINRIDERLEKLRQKLDTVKEIRPTDIVFLKKDKKVLDRKEFESEDFMNGYVKIESYDDIDAGDFVRYKTKRLGEPVKYLWGGVVIFKDQEYRYLRIKNPYANRVWSVQLANPDIKHVFYVRKKLESTLDPDGEYVDLNKASAEGLIAKAIGREGGTEMILRAAHEIRKNNRTTYMM